MSILLFILKLVVILFIVTFVVYFFNLDMKLMGFMFNLLEPVYDKVKRNKKL